MTAESVGIIHTLTRHSLHLVFLFAIAFRTGQRECASQAQSRNSHGASLGTVLPTDVIITEESLMVMVTLFLLFLSSTYNHPLGCSRDGRYPVWASVRTSCLIAEDREPHIHMLLLLKHVFRRAVVTAMVGVVWAVCCFFCGSLLREIDPFACVYVACLFLQNPAASSTPSVATPDAGAAAVVATPLAAALSLDEKDITAPGRTGYADKGQVADEREMSDMYYCYMNAVITGLVAPSAVYLLDWDRGGGCGLEGGGGKESWLLLSPLPTLVGGYMGTLMGEGWYWYWYKCGAVPQLTVVEEEQEEEQEEQKESTWYKEESMGRR